VQRSWVALGLMHLILVDYILCRRESSAKMKDDLTRLLRRLEKINNDLQYRKNVRTTTV